jgi:uncharacterized protein YegP (UPF0339 family)
VVPRPPQRAIAHSVVVRSGSTLLEPAASLTDVSVIAVADSYPAEGWARTVKFKIVQDASRHFSWRLVASNSLIIAVGVEAYDTRAECRRAIDFVIGAAAAHFHVYQDFQQLWRWHLRSITGQVVAISGETYVTQQGALDSAARAAHADAHTLIEDVHDSGSMRTVKPTGSSSSG